MKLKLGRREIEILRYDPLTNHAYISYKINGTLMFKKEVYCWQDSQNGSFFKLGSSRFYLTEFVRG